MFELGGEGDEVLICLQQEDRRMKRREGAGENLPIGFEVLRVRVCVQSVTATVITSSHILYLQIYEVQTC